MRLFFGSLPTFQKARALRVYNLFVGIGKIERIQGHLKWTVHITEKYDLDLIGDSWVTPRPSTEGRGFNHWTRHVQGGNTTPPPHIFVSNWGSWQLLAKYGLVLVMVSLAKGGNT